MKLFLIAVVGMLVGGAATYIALGEDLHLYTHNHADHHDNHPIADPYDTEYHVHADFHIVINGTQVDLSGEQFQTTSQQELHDDLHLHDNNGEVVHIHAEDKTFTEFLNSIGIALTENCVTLDNRYCSNDTQRLKLFVNNERYTDQITEYVPVDDDRILLYYGVDDDAFISERLDAIPADSCYYSGTCPERGIAPPESCGLECEL
jgi:hypothetical protein